MGGFCGRLLPGPCFLFLFFVLRLAQCFGERFGLCSFPGGAFLLLPCPLLRALYPGRTHRPDAVNQARLAGQDIVIVAVRILRIVQGMGCEVLVIGGIRRAGVLVIEAGSGCHQFDHRTQLVDLHEVFRGGLAVEVAAQYHGLAGENFLQHPAVANFKQLDEAGFHPLRIVLGKHLTPEGDIKFFHPVPPRLSNSAHFCLWPFQNLEGWQWLSN